MDDKLQELSQTGSEVVKTFVSVLAPEFTSKSVNLSDEAVATEWSKGLSLNTFQYTAILTHLNTPTVRYSSALVLPVDPDTVLPNIARQHAEITWNKHIYSTVRTHLGNASIFFYDPAQSDRKLSGGITSIWTLPLGGQLRTFFFVDGHKPLLPHDAEKSPYTKLPDMQTQVVAAEYSGYTYLIEPEHVITHAAMYRRPKGTFGMSCEVFVVCVALNRGRK